MFDQFTKFTDEATATFNQRISEVLDESFTANADKILDAVLDANRRLVDVTVDAADRIAEQVNVDLPFVDRLPTPTVAGRQYLEFVERAVSLNRELNQRVVDMIKADDAKTVAANVTASVTSAAKKSPARKTTARKTAAKKSPARKSPVKQTTAETAASST